MYLTNSILLHGASLVAQSVKSLFAMQKTWGSIPASGRSHGEGNSNPLQYSCLGNPMDRGAWQPTVHGVARVGYNWVTKLTYRPMKVKSLSRVRLFTTPWTVAHQAPPSMGFSRQEYWSGLPFPSPGESSRPRDQTQVSRIAGRRFNLWATRKAHTAE